MKILHTADLHLGKKLFERDRLAEQERVGMEIAEIARAHAVDLIVIAGDIFDTSTPSAAAEELFYRLAVAYSRIARVLVISGNHDDPDRLTAAKDLAKYNGILLAGDFGVPTATTDVLACGEGWLKLKLGAETAEILLAPYPTDARLGDIVADGEPFSARVKRRLYSAAEQCFTDPSAARLLVGHLFCLGAQKSGSERDIELGTARILPLDCFPDCHYAALGHIHKPMSLSKTRAVSYAGAPLAFTFDETGEKSVSVVTVERGAVEVERVPLTRGAELKRITASTVEEAEVFMTAHPDALIECKLVLDRALITDESKRLRAHANLVNLLLERTDKEVVKSAINRVGKSVTEVFTEYCEAQKVQQTPELTALFLELMGEV